MLTENKFSKYLLYAIGEIILVIIGILIAVSINGWNEGRKLKIEEQSILIDLKEEVTSNLKELEKIIEEHEHSFKAAEEIRALFEDREAFNNVPDSLFRSMFIKMNINYTYDPSNGILNSIISSGKINQFSNKKLKYRLASIQEETIDAFESSMKIEEQRDELVYSTINNARIIEDRKFIDGVLASQINWKSFYDYGGFRTLTSVFYFNRKGGLEEEHELKKALEHILELIDHETEK